MWQVTKKSTTCGKRSYKAYGSSQEKVAKSLGELLVLY